MNEQIVRYDPLEMLTVREAAKLLHVSRPTIEKYVKSGALPSVILGRCRRIRRADLDTFLAERTECGWRRTDDPGRRVEPLPCAGPSATQPGRPPESPSSASGGDDIVF